ncbi:hypothetical protein BX261_7291 [Streptomyces sp. 2321.6]|uniref:hypothetical protein n=1 Tax=Streptomyces sp. 2321.6 TaxID=1938840 RepID=UPI000BB104CB|nr:hypothetical protein [Streptomyces sp. 2321.6]PBC72417.1 hypothetical protein BX261_7291 [Streptomyces sp. 2321.6]
MAKRTTGDGGEAAGGNRLFIASAAVILIVVLLGVFVVATSGDDDKNGGAAGAQPTSGSTPTSSSSGGAGDGQAPADDGNGCKPSDTDKSVPTAAPDDVSWDLVTTVALPRSKSAGPLKIDGKVASCYAHTPRGALMAAANGFYRSILSAPDVKPLKAQVLPGAGRDALEKQLKKIDQPVQSGQMAQIAGFRIVSYTDTTTVVSLVNGSQSAQSLKASDITVQWSGNDWKIVPPPGGGLNTPGDQLSSLDGYIPFGGV